MVQHEFKQEAGSAPIELPSAYIQKITRFQGPIPSPDAFQEYGAVVPGLPEKIIAWTEEEQVHRREMERYAIFAEVHSSQNAENVTGRGQILSFIIVMAVLVVAVMGIFQGTSMVGLGSVFLAGAGLAWVVFGKRPEHAPHQEPAPPAPPQSETEKAAPGAE